MAEATLAATLLAARRKLEAAGIAESALDARMLVEHMTGTSRSDALLRPDLIVTDAQAAAIDEALGQRIAGRPVHRIIGHRDFHGVRLTLSPATLDPRPDTEALVDMALEMLAGKPRPRVLDLGTGTGAIALAILSARPDATAVAVDISAEAVATASRNAEANGVADRCTGIVSDWFAAVEGRFDAILSNPPYIVSAEIAKLAVEVREHDPMLALDGGEDGLEAYRIIAHGASQHLASAGFVAVEIGHDQAESVPGVFLAEGLVEAGGRDDLSGIRRALTFRAG